MRYHPATSRQPEPLLRVNCFEVLIGDREIGFAEVGRLTSETELSGLPDRPVHRFASVVLRRALTTSTELYDWRRGIISGKDDRRDVTIRQLSVPGGSGPFNAKGTDVAIEELTLADERLELE